MATVDIGIGHNNNLVVAQAINIKRITNPHANRLDQRYDLFIGEHFIEPRPLGVEHLTTQRQNGLGIAIAAFLGGTSRRVTLHNVEFTIGRLAG